LREIAETFSQHLQLLPAQPFLQADEALVANDEVYHLTRILYKAVLGTHFIRKQQKRTGQLALF
jgi:hypothetical protein